MSLAERLMTIVCAQVRQGKVGECSVGRNLECLVSWVEKRTLNLLAKACRGA